MADPTAYYKAMGPEGRQGGLVIAVEREVPEQAGHIVPDLVSRQIQIGHIQAEAAAGHILDFPLNLYLGAVAGLFAHDDMPPRFGLGVRWLMPPLFDRDAGTDHRKRHAQRL